MNSNKFYKYKFLTKKAFEFQSKIMSGKIMNFTKAEIGDGTIDAEEAETLQSLKNKICNAEIISIAPNQPYVERLHISAEQLPCNMVNSLHVD